MLDTEKAVISPQFEEDSLIGLNDRKKSLSASILLLPLHEAILERNIIPNEFKFLS